MRRAGEEGKRTHRPARGDPQEAHPDDRRPGRYHAALLAGLTSAPGGAKEGAAPKELHATVTFSDWDPEAREGVFKDGREPWPARSANVSRPSVPRKASVLRPFMPRLARKP
jgi:hypothetical protein